MNFQTARVTATDFHIAWLAALAVVIHIVEAHLPTPLPGIKPGLANVVTIVVLMRYGYASAAWVVLLRILASSLFLGTFLSPTFALSAAGGLASLGALAMACYWQRWSTRWRLSALGFSLLAAVAHILGQFSVAYALFIPHPVLWHLLPLFLLAALVFGTLVGLVSQRVFMALSTK